MKFDPIVLNISLILAAGAACLVLGYFFPQRGWYFYLAVGLTVVMIMIFSISNLYNSLRDDNDETFESGAPQAIPAPETYPSTPPKWMSRGEWSIPFSVRYAVSYVVGNEQGSLGPWSPYYSSVEFSNPVLSDFPQEQGENVQIDKINIYRQFEGHEPIIIDSVDYPFNGDYADISGDDY